MAIIQISKIQQRSGNLVDLPQLDEAEFGFASDDKRLFIGKEAPNENIEVLTSYSEISLSQLEGAVGNLNIDPVTVANGQVLAFDGTNWVNKGGNAGGLITLGNISNVRIDGGAIGYVLETDGTGNLNWTPKSTITSYILNVTQANPAVVTTTSDNFFTDAAEVTITNVTGMTELNGNTYYVNILTSNTFALYSDSALTTSINSTGYGAFPYTTASATTSVGNVITVASSAAFSVNDPIAFVGSLGNSGIVANTTYYVKTLPSGTEITITDVVGGSPVALVTDTVSATVYAPGGRVISAVGGAGATAAAGSTTSIQYNDSGVLQGSSDLTWNFSTTPRLLTVNGNANVGNLNSSGIVTGVRFISNVTTGTAPLIIASTTRVANLNVSYANVSDFGVVTTQSTGIYYPVFVNGSTTANYALASNAGINANLANGSITATTFIGNIIGNISGTLTAPGANTQVIFNDAGNANATSGLTFNKSNNQLSVSGNANVGNIGGTNGVFTSISGTLTTASQTNITSVGTLGNLSVTANVTAGNLIANTTLQTTNITTGANTTAGSITGNWSLTTGSRLIATYADLAEYYSADRFYGPGTVLEFGGDYEVTLGTVETSKVAGVVSSEPAYVMNGTCPGEFPTAIALQGRVICKVRGPVSKGDMLVSAGDGYAKASKEPKIGTIIGKSLENLSAGQGMIEVAVGRL